MDLLENEYMFRILSAILGRSVELASPVSIAYQPP